MTSTVLPNPRIFSDSEPQLGWFPADTGSTAAIGDVVYVDASNQTSSVLSKDFAMHTKAAVFAGSLPITEMLRLGVYKPQAEALTLADARFDTLRRAGRIGLAVVGGLIEGAAGGMIGAAGQALVEGLLAAQSDDVRRRRVDAALETILSRYSSEANETSAFELELSDALTRFGTIAIEAIGAKIFDAPNAEASQSMLSVIGKAEDPELQSKARQLLVAALNSSHPALRFTAVRALGERGDAPSMAALSKRRQLEKNRVVLSMIDAHI